MNNVVKLKSCICSALGPEAPTSGYSDQALQSRKMILDGALETLGTMTIRREYDERVQLGAIEELIPGKHVAGALILLSEANEDQAVVEAGMPWLEKHPRHKCTKDVATVVGFSYFNIARRLIDARESLVDARMLLDQALGVLKRFGGSYSVEKIASQSLEELGPRLALELVSSTDQGAKKEGILLLPSALSKLKKESEKDRRSQQTWLSYLDRVRQILTADELIELFNVSENVFTDPRELYYVSVAHIAAACHNVDPKLVSIAKILLLRAEKLASHQGRRSDSAGDSGVVVASRKMAEEKQRRLMALACSELLLGDSGAAAEALGLRTDPITCDRQIYTFIKVCCILSSYQEFNSVTDMNYFFRILCCRTILVARTRCFQAFVSWWKDGFLMWRYHPFTKSQMLDSHLMTGLKTLWWYPILKACTQKMDCCLGLETFLG